MLQGELDLGMISSPGPWRPERPERLFFGVLLNTDAAVPIDRFRRHFCSKNHVAGTLRGRERLHISLHHVGRYTHLPSRIIYAAKWAGQAASMPPFEVTLHSIMSFAVDPPKQALVLLAESAGLMEFRRALGTAMRKIGLKAEEHFSPHVTLLYGPNSVPKQGIEPIRFVVKEFALIHSELGLSRYSVIDRWSLND